MSKSNYRKNETQNINWVPRNFVGFSCLVRVMKEIIQNIFWILLWTSILYFLTKPLFYLNMSRRGDKILHKIVLVKSVRTLKKMKLIWFKTRMTSRFWNLMKVCKQGNHQTVKNRSYTESVLDQKYPEKIIYFSWPKNLQKEKKKNTKT